MQTTQDPDLKIIPCEAPDCTVEKSRREMHSVKAVWCHTWGITPFQCENEQHWGCTPEHAVDAMVLCVREHLLPGHAALVAERDNAPQFGQAKWGEATWGKVGEAVISEE